MDKTLYQQLLDAVSVLLYIDDKNQKIQSHKKSISEKTELLQKERVNAYKFPSKAWLVLGTMFFSISCILIFDFFLKIFNSNLPIYELLYSILIFIIIIPLIPSLILFSNYVKYNKRRKKRISDFESTSKVIEQEIQAEKLQINTLSNEINEYKAKTKHYVDFLAPTYDNTAAAIFLFTCIRDGRADTLKEAKNLYEEQISRWKIENILTNAIKAQNTQNNNIINNLIDIRDNQSKINRIINFLK